MRVLIFLVLIGYSSPASIRTQENDDIARMTVPQLIEYYGYKAEQHSVTTEDGYVLSMHRILGGKSGKNNGKVAYLQHGLLSSSADWLIAGDSKGLGFILADQGYDVWLGNYRGNKYSRNHTTISPDQLDFWEFSWNENGRYDIPAMIDHILDITGKDGVYYVGHSMGTTGFYVMASERPEYNAKIKAQISLAPIAFMNHMTSPLVHLAAFWEGPLNLLLNLIGIGEFLPSNEFLANVGPILCGDDSFTQVLCTNALFAICGFSEKEMDASLLPVLMGHTPAGSSSRQFLHYAQEVNTGTFQKYDFGAIGNLKTYGSIFPPKYDLSKVTAPVYLFYSHNDWLSGEEDVVKLSNKLGNLQGKFLVSDNSFNHLDYMYGTEAPKILYPKIISLFARH